MRIEEVIKYIISESKWKSWDGSIYPYDFKTNNTGWDVYLNNNKIGRIEKSIEETDVMSTDRYNYKIGTRQRQSFLAYGYKGTKEINLQRYRGHFYKDKYDAVEAINKFMGDNNG